LTIVLLSPDIQTTMASKTLRPGNDWLEVTEMISECRSNVQGEKRLKNE